MRDPVTVHWWNHFMDLGLEVRLSYVFLVFHVKIKIHLDCKNQQGHCSSWLPMNSPIKLKSTAFLPLSPCHKFDKVVRSLFDFILVKEV